MSRIGKKPINVPPEVDFKIEGNQCSFKGPLGELKLSIPPEIGIKFENGIINVSRLVEHRKAKALHGTYARLISNSIKGVLDGFSKDLEVIGTGYRAEFLDGKLTMSLGYSHPVIFQPPEGISVQVKENKINVSGINKELVGLVADRIKRLRPPDAYKGKGIRYLGERLRLKPGKAAAKATTK